MTVFAFDDENQNLVFLRGTPEDDLLVAASGNDNPFYIYGDAGNDVLIGSVSDDILIGGIGADILIGGDGIDFADYSGSLEGVIVTLPSPDGSEGRGYTGDAAGDRLIGIEGLIGSAFADHLVGGRGNDFLYGGQGGDVFVLTSGGFDVVIDFRPDQGDRLQLGYANNPDALVIIADTAFDATAFGVNGTVLTLSGNYNGDRAMQVDGVVFLAGVNADTVVDWLLP